MSYLPSIAVVGGDARQKWLATALQRRNALSAVYEVPDFASPASVTVLTTPADLCHYTCIVGPVPLARQGNLLLPPTAQQSLPLSLLLQIMQPGQLIAGGNLPAAFLQQCQARQIQTYDFLQSSTLTLANAEITAEGMLAILLQQTPYVLQNTSLLLLGYGRCGMALAHKLTALGCQVLVCESNLEKRSLARSFGYNVLTPEGLPAVLPTCELLVNTVPALVLTYDLLQLLPTQAMLFDLASAPGGIDQQAAQQLHLYYQNCPGLPGRTAPQTAGELLAENLLHYLATVPVSQKG